MDKLGFRHQFLPPAIQPLERNMVTIGRAMTVLEADYFEEAAAAGHNPLSGRPFGLMLDALDDLKPNEVYTCTGGSAHYALWGELMSTRAIHCGAAGAVLDGYSRDTRGILELGFPPSPMDRSRWTRGLAARSWTTVCPSKCRARASNLATSFSGTWMASASYREQRSGMCFEESSKRPVARRPSGRLWSRACPRAKPSRNSAFSSDARSPITLR